MSSESKVGKSRRIAAALEEALAEHGIIGVPLERITQRVLDELGLPEPYEKVQEPPEPEEGADATEAAPAADGESAPAERNPEANPARQPATDEPAE